MARFSLFLSVNSLQQTPPPVYKTGGPTTPPPLRKARNPVENGASDNSIDTRAIPEKPENPSHKLLHKLFMSLTQSAPANSQPRYAPEDPGYHLDERNVAKPVRTQHATTAFEDPSADHAG